MALNTTATLSSDIVFKQQETDTNSSDNRQGSLSYSQALTAGTGSLQIDSVFNIQSHSLASGETYAIDFNNLTQPIVGGIMNLSFSKIKGINIHNSSSIAGEDLNVRATGSNAFTAPFNGGSGNLLVKASSAYCYGDPHTGITVDNSNKHFQIVNEGTGAIPFTIVAVGVTG